MASLAKPLLPANGDADDEHRPNSPSPLSIDEERLPTAASLSSFHSLPLSEKLVRLLHTRASLYALAFIIYFLLTAISLVFARTQLSNVMSLCFAAYQLITTLTLLLVASYVGCVIVLMVAYRQQIVRLSYRHKEFAMSASAVSTSDSVTGDDPALDLPILSIVPPEAYHLATFDWFYRLSPRTRQVVRYSVLTVCLLLLLALLVISLILFGAIILIQLKTEHREIGQLRLNGLQHEVTVSRDARDNIRIVASTEHDLYFAQGAVHMQQRMWQVEFQRAVGKGTLSSLVGDGALPIDKVSRLMGYQKAANASLKHISPRSIVVAQAFIDGANAYLATNPPVSLEFVVLGLPLPQPMVLTDILVWSKILAYSLSGNLDQELNRWALLVEANLTTTRISQLIPPFNTNRFPTIVPSPQPSTSERTEEASSAAEPIVAWLHEHRELLRERPTPERHFTRLASMLRNFRETFFGSTHASNSWLVAGSRTASGLPLLANDPHLQLTAPSIWLTQHLVLQRDDGTIDVDLMGAGLVGVPSVLIGRTNSTSWGFTNTGADVQDVYVMKDSADGMSYLLANGTSVRYEMVEERIDVQGASSPVVFKFRRSHYGPVISDLPDLLPTLNGHSVPAVGLSLRWTALNDADTTVDSFLELSRAKSFADFRRALTLSVAPSQNAIFASTSGEIGYQMMNLIPNRRSSHSGQYPVPGDGEFDWQGYLELEVLPSMHNPKDGYIVTANNRVTPTNFPIVVSRDWDSFDGYRAKRILQLIGATAKHTVESMRMIQSDEDSLLYTDFAPLIAELQPQTPAGLFWKSRFQTFNGSMIIGSQDASVFELFMLSLYRLTLNETGASNPNTEYIYNVFRLRERDLNCDSFKDGALSGCLGWASKQFDLVVDGATSVERWGSELKKVIFQHPVLGNSPLACLANRITTHGGDTFTVNVGPFPRPNDDEVTTVHSFSQYNSTSNPPLGQAHGSSYRQIIDLSDMDNSVWQNTLGNGGDILQPSYDQTLEEWRTLTLQPMTDKNFQAVRQQLLLNTTTAM